MASLLGRLVPHRTLAIGLAIGLVAGSVGVVYAKPGGDCHQQVAGTYFKSADVLTTLSADGTFSGQLSKTDEPYAGIGETFTGKWSCTRSGVTVEDFRFYQVSGIGYVERANGVGTYSPADGGTLTLTYTFTSFPESATPDDLRSGSGSSQVTIPPVDIVRVSTP